MTNAARTTALMAMVLVLVACAGPLRGMREVPVSQVRTTPPAHQAAIIFLRPSTMGYAIASSVFELRDDGERFIGIVPAKKKLVHHVDAGRRRFMVVSEAADFMDAELETGKTYYALVTPRMGVWKARFSLRPVMATELDGQHFREWLEACEWIENTEETREWARSNSHDIQHKRVEYLRKWEPRGDKPTLQAVDGR